VKNLPRVVTWCCNGQESKQRSHSHCFDMLSPHRCNNYNGYLSLTSRSVNTLMSFFLSITFFVTFAVLAANFYWKMVSLDSVGFIYCQSHRSYFVLLI